MIRILPFTKDLRDDAGRASAAYLEQARADHALEAEWRRRVAENERRRFNARLNATEGADHEFPRSNAA